MADTGKLTAGIGKGLSLLQGLGQIGLSNAQSADTNFDPNLLDINLSNMRMAGRRSYGSYSDLASDYALMSAPKLQTQEETRGMNGWQKAGTIGQGALSSAMTGLSVAGPWGALAGGLLGAALSVPGILAGDMKAKNQFDYQNDTTALAYADGRQNMLAAAERFGNNNHNNTVVNFRRQGGAIKQVSLRDYAAKVTGKKDYEERPVRRYCKGGLMVRVKK